MNWRKLNRIIHRDLGYIFFGMTIIYSVSGVALNHLSDWNPNYIIRNHTFTTEIKLNQDNINKNTVFNLLTEAGLKKKYKKYYFPSPGILKVFLEDGSLVLDTETGKGNIETIRRRPVFKEMNFLHYNNAKHLYTWFADLFGAALILVAVSGLFILKGRKGITGRGAWLTSAGILIPIIFLLFYL